MNTLSFKGFVYKTCLCASQQGPPGFNGPHGGVGQQVNCGEIQTPTNDQH